MVVLELIRKVCRVKRGEKGKYIKIIIFLLNAPSAAIIYECAGTLVSLSSTPTEPKPSSPDAKLVQSNNDLGLCKQVLADSKYSKDSTLNDEDRDDDGNDECGGRRFLQPMESPYPGGSTLGSATSNYDDDFLDQYQLILSDLVDYQILSYLMKVMTGLWIQLFFFMHFRSLARLSNLDGSSGMSLVGEDSHRYDYANLSLGLDALLAEGRKDLQADVVYDNTSVAKSLINKRSTPLLSDVSELVRSYETVTISKVKLNDENNGFVPCALTESHSNSLTLHDRDNANTCLRHDVDLGKKTGHGSLSAIC